MSKLDDLTAMKQLTEIKYRREQESFGRLLMQENNLRASLAQLDSYMAESQSSTDTPQKAIGADVVWQAWIGRNKRAINMQLAQVLAIKERHIAQVRAAYGKVVVTDELHDRLRKETAEKKAQVQLDRAISSMLFRSDQ